MVHLDPSAAATPEIAKPFKNDGCYTVDPSDQTLHVVQQGWLSVVRFDRPITREAEVFEQSYQAR
jgi:hypothetical protein